MRNYPQDHKDQATRSSHSGSDLTVKKARSCNILNRKYIDVKTTFVYKNLLNICMSFKKSECIQFKSFT